MFLLCMSTLIVLTFLKGWQVYMMTARTDDWLRIAEADHRKKLAWAEMLGERGKRIAERLSGWLTS